MSRLFSIAKKAPPVEETVQSMKDTMVTIEKREIYLQQKCNYETEVARRNARTNKRAAMQALKKRKTYQQQLDRLSNARMTLENQIMHIENAAITHEALRAMERGAETMAHQQRNMSVNDVDRIMEKIQDQMDVQEGINDALSEPLEIGLYDDDDLEAELAALEDEMMGAGEKIMTRIPVQTVPVVYETPNLDPIPSREDEEIRRLEAGMLI